MNYTRKLECDCELFTTIEHEPDIIFCPKHKAAPDLYEALKAIDNHWRSKEAFNLRDIEIMKANAREALAKVESKE